MGVAADFATVPADRWPAVLARIRASGVEITAGAQEDDVRWYSCVRGGCTVELACDAGAHVREVVLYAPAVRCWRRPVGMWRLLRDVRRALLAAGGTAT